MEETPEPAPLSAPRDLMLIKARAITARDNAFLYKYMVFMPTIKDFMTADHRQCDEFLAHAGQAVARCAWECASAAFAQFQQSVLRHFAAEEETLFPAFEAKTGMSTGPTQVMRGEHVQLRQLMDAACQALAARDADDYAGNTETLLIMLQQHNLKEENVLYPLCDRQLLEQRPLLLPRLQEQIGGQTA